LKAKYEQRLLEINDLVMEMKGAPALGDVGDIVSHKHFKTTEEILTDNGIRNQGSPDTLAVWNSKPSR